MKAFTFLALGLLMLTSTAHAEFVKGRFKAQTCGEGALYDSKGKRIPTFVSERIRAGTRQGVAAATYVAVNDNLYLVSSPGCPVTARCLGPDRLTLVGTLDNNGDVQIKKVKKVTLAAVVTTVKGLVTAVRVFHENNSDSYIEVKNMEPQVTTADVQ